MPTPPPFLEEKMKEFDRMFPRLPEDEIRPVSPEDRVMLVKTNGHNAKLGTMRKFLRFAMLASYHQGIEAGAKSRQGEIDHLTQEAYGTLTKPDNK